MSDKNICRCNTDYSSKSNNNAKRDDNPNIVNPGLITTFGGSVEKMRT